ncbi:Sel1 repeat-containing protein [Duganella sp. CF402]|uniref:TonB family protein n=1 Tax=unclassified Duganella TaxID=2636909 RepID=UPI0008D71772|nr:MULTISPECIES: TonB family protein [unclassified Duganella]RZT05472.1 TonB family protein [Duganella sp. BK701]SEN02821.1 Sel1 repeat-containing protein [Duganella sp. CF402]
MRILAPLLLSVAVTANAADAPAQTPASANFRTCEKPAWPRDTLYDGQPGVVIIGFLVGEDGKVIDTVIRSSSGVPALDRASLAAIKRCQFMPATAGGVPVSSWTSVRYNWSRSSTDNTLADFETYRAQAKTGDAAALYKLALLFRDGVGIENDIGRYDKLLRSSAEAGYAEAEFQLSFNLRFGKYGSPKDEQQALAWQQKAAEHGSVIAQNLMGDFHQSVKGSSADQALAADWYRKAAELGSVDAQYKLAQMLETGRGVAQNIGEAIAWYRKAADRGYIAACAHLGNLYLQGQGVERDPVQALALLSKAAEQRQPSAEITLANLYLNGTGVPQSDAEGVKYLRRAAIASNIAAMRQLAQMLEQGSHMAADPKEAALWQAKVARLDKVVSEADVPRFGDW